MKKIFALCLLLSVMACPAMAGPSKDAATPDSAVGKWLVDNGQGYFWKAIQMAGQESMVSGGAMTFLVPDEAELEAEQKTEILKNAASAKAFLNLHVIKGQVSASRLKKLEEVETVSGQELSVETEDGLSLDGCMVTKSVDQGSMTFHVLDSVISSGDDEGDDGGMEDEDE